MGRREEREEEREGGRERERRERETTGYEPSETVFARWITIKPSNAANTQLTVWPYVEHVWSLGVPTHAVPRRARI